MKKFVTTIFAVMIVAMSCVTAFAAASPEATVIPNKPSTGTSTNGSSSSNVVVDSGPKSPKTGSSDVLPYTVIGLSALACGTAAVMLAKTRKSK